MLNVARSYADDTANLNQIRVLDHAASHGWAQSELRGKLRGIMKTDEWRVQRALNITSRHCQALSDEAIKGRNAVEKAMERRTNRATLIDKWAAVDRPILRSE